jgi:hypothetical protein
VNMACQTGRVPHRLQPAHDQPFSTCSTRNSSERRETRVLLWVPHLRCGPKHLLVSSPPPPGGSMGFDEFFNWLNSSHSVLYLTPGHTTTG